MSDSDDNDSGDRTLDIRNNTPTTTKEPKLSEKSMKTYEVTYDVFMAWKKKKNKEGLSENVLMAYFTEIAQQLSPSTLWSRYSMLKNTLQANNNVDISTYTELNAFLKKKSIGFTSKKSKTLTADEISKFLNDAPDEQYLATKVNKIYIYE